MARKRKIRYAETYDAFYCTIDDWRREYSFGIKYPESRRDTSGRSYVEWDHVQVVGKIRHHSRGRTTRRRLFETFEVGLCPIHSPRDEWEKDPKDIGGIWMRREANLGFFIDVPVGAYYSLIHSLSANRFKELRVTIRNFLYSRGSVDGIAFNSEETPSEEMY